MPFDDQLAKRIRKRLGEREGLAEKQMFGGIAFLLNGNMCCGVHGNEMIVRISADDTDAALKEPHTRVFDLTGRRMKGWILVAQGGLKTDGQLAAWVERAFIHAESLPPK